MSCNPLLGSLGPVERTRKKKGPEERKQKKTHTDELGTIVKVERATLRKQQAALYCSRALLFCLPLDLLLVCSSSNAKQKDTRKKRIFKSRFFSSLACCCYGPAPLRYQKYLNN